MCPAATPGHAASWSLQAARTEQAGRRPVAGPVAAKCRASPAPARRRESWFAPGSNSRRSVEVKELWAGKREGPELASSVVSSFRMWERDDQTIAPNRAHPSYGVRLV